VGRYLAFFLHVCDVFCVGKMPDAGVGPVEVDGVWRIVVQDRVSRQINLTSAEFR
jgi:hypothetical protein